MNKETIIYTDKEQVWCMGEDLDHPKVFYKVPEKGTVTCLYCNIQYTRDKKYKNNSNSAKKTR